MYKKALLIPIIALTSLSSLFLILSPIHAATTASSSANPSPTVEPVSIDEVTENLKKRLQESLENKESAPTDSARAYIGVVKDVIKDTIIIEDKDGKKDVKLEDSTTIVRSPGNTVIKPENIRIDDYIIAIGFPGEGEILKGRRLIVSVEPIKSPEKKSGLGTISKIGKNSLTLTVEGAEQVMTLTSKTILKSPVGTIDLTDLAVGDVLIYTALIDDEDLTATILMRVKTSSISE